MAAYGEPFQQFDDSGLPVPPPMGRMGGMEGASPEPPASRATQTLGLASARQIDGDNLQSATAGMLHEIYYENKDPELGIVIGECTDLEPVPMKKAVVKKEAAVARAAAPAPPPAPPQICGIGLKIADEPPHKVLAVNKLKDGQDRNINNKVKAGDTLEQVDDTYVEQMHIDELENLIFGTKGSMAELVFRRARGNEIYKVSCKRHIPIMFALGMSITTKPPHVVTRVDDLRDENNNIVNHLVTPGHTIEYVDGTHVDDLPVQRLEAIVFGHLNSHVNITFRDPQTRQDYDVRLLRHVPVASWLRWEDQGGKTGPPSTNQATLDHVQAPVLFNPNAPPPPPPGGSAGYMPMPGGSAGYMPGPPDLLQAPMVPMDNQYAAYPPPSQAPALAPGAAFVSQPGGGQEVVGEFI